MTRVYFRDAARACSRDATTSREPFVLVREAMTESSKVTCGPGNRGGSLGARGEPGWSARDVFDGGTRGGSTIARQWSITLRSPSMHPTFPYTPSRRLGLPQAATNSCIEKSAAAAPAAGLQRK